MTEKADNKKHVIAILVDNEAGALARIVELFSGRGYNIESLTVDVVNVSKNVSRVTIATYGSQETVDLICKLLMRIVPVHKAIDLTKYDGYIERGLALVKIIGKREMLEKAITVSKEFRSNIVYATDNSIVFEVMGTSDAVDSFINLMQPLGLDSVSKTGMAAGLKGEVRLEDLEIE